MSIFSEVKVYPQNNSSSSLLARGSFVVSGAVKVNFAYVNGSKGPFVSLPQDKVVKDGETKYYPHAKLINRDAITELNKLVETAYEEAKNGQSVDKSTNQDAPSDDQLPF